VKILLIDQDLNTLEKVQISLRRAGYQVLIAADRDAGLRLAREDRPNLIILDLLLTGLDGLDLCQQLRQEETTEAIPIFLLTSLTVPQKDEPWQPTPQAKCQTLNYQDYLPKPVDTNYLIRKVDALLKPEARPGRPAGPTIFLLMKDPVQLATIQQALEEADFDVATYDNVTKALSAMYRYLPASLVIESDLLANQNTWTAINRFRERHPTHSVIVLQKNPPLTSPENLAQIDDIINAPARPWQIVTAVQKSLEYRRLNARVNALSKQVLSLNWELVDSKQTMQYQNQELDLVNRQLRQLNELKETLTGMLVHDLKAPLSAIMGSLQFLTMDPNNTLSENSQRILSGGLAAGQQMLRMTHTLLDEQKLENDQLIFDIEPTDLEQSLEMSIEMLSPLLNMHKVQIDLSLEADLPPVMADPIILQRIIENLLDNAIKYSPAEEVITIKVIRNSNFAEFCIMDRGDGIPPEHRDLIFDRFIQLPDFDTGKIRGGVGLGLAFCKLAVVSMGGKIWVDSPNDIGTAFFFTLPLVTEETVDSSE